uniref:WD repeat domain phosphoinositide-interacting protein 3 n=1 Tax=Macrostomum lignano TaxID=282301 RepID=A0A1I8GAV9_9PLAT
MCNGFRIYNTEPLKEKERQDFPGESGSGGAMGGVRLIEMLYRCNYVGLAFSNNPKYPPNKAVIWDDVKKKIVIGLHTAVKVFTFTQPPSLLHVFESSPNPHGLIALCPSSDRQLLAFPGHSSGSVALADLGQPDRPKGQSANLLHAHEGRLAALSMNSRGTFGLLCAASDRGTVHVFRLDYNDQQLSQRASGESQQQQHHALEASPATAAASVAKFFSQVTSVARLPIQPGVPTVCAFGQDSLGRTCSLIAITASGNYLKFKLGPGSISDQVHREVYTNYLDMTQDSNN